MRLQISTIAAALVLASGAAYPQSSPLTPHTLQAGDIVAALGYVPANAATVQTGGTSCNAASYTTSGCVTVSTGLLASQGALSVIYGTVAGTATQGNDSRLGLASTALQPSALSPYALLASPIFSGVPTAPTAPAGSNSPQLATTGFVTNAISGLSTGSSTYTLPPATSTTIGGVKASARLMVASDGTEDLAQQGAATGQVLTWNGSYWAPSTVSTGSSSYTLPAASNSTLGGITVSTGLNIATGALSVAYGTAAGTAAPGNDSRFGLAAAETTRAENAEALLAPLASPQFTGSPLVPGYETTAAAASLAPKASPTFTGTVTAPTFSGALTGNVTGNVTGTASNITGTAAIANGGTGSTTASGALMALGGAPLTSPVFGGVPTAPTASAGTNNTQIATTGFVAAAVSSVSSGSSGSSNLNTAPAATAAPTSGTYAVGTFVQNSNPSEQGSTGAKYVTFGFVNIVAGSPGTWVPLNVFDGN